MKLTKLETFIVEVPPPGYGGNYWFFIKLHMMLPAVMLLKTKTQSHCICLAQSHIYK